jgi:hypothetical protein
MMRSNMVMKSNVVRKFAAMTVALVACPFVFGQAPSISGPVPANPNQAQAAAPAPLDLNPGVTELMKLAESGVTDEVMISYINNSRSAYNLTADQILYLKDVGFSSEVLTAMLSHDKAVAVQPAPPAAQPAPVVTPSAPQYTTQPAVVNAPPPEYVSNPPVEVNYFYNDLAPYGTWVSLEGYGWCWQPRAMVVSRTWRPYCDGGHWVYSDAGWYWASDYSWGWAPFHYGRWYMHPRYNWVWMPDTVWAPAWVVWRSSGDHCGWAPVPPHATFDVRFGWRYNGVSVGLNFDFGLRPDHFTFIAMHDFTHHDLRVRRVGHTEVTKIYNNTTIINNYQVNNNVIVNRGVPVDRVASATHTQIRKATVRDLPADRTSAAAVRRSADRNDVVYRPELKAPSRPVNVVAQKVDERHPVIHHEVLPTRTERQNDSRGTVTSGARRLGSSNSQEMRSGQRSSGGEIRSESRSGVSAPPAPSAPSAPRAMEEKRGASPGWGAPSYRGNEQNRGSTGQPEARGQNPHMYPPKSSQQSSDIRSAPRNERSDRSEHRDNSNHGNNSDSKDKRKD